MDPGRHALLQTALRRHSALTRNGHLPPTLFPLRSAGIEPADSDELRLKKVVLLFACGLMIAAAAIWLALYQALGLPVSASWPLAFQVASMVTLIYYLVTLNFDVFRAVQLGMFLFVPFAVQWSIGNFVSASGMILWGLLAPVGAVLLYSARESIPWIAAYIVLTLASGYVDYQLAWLPPKAPKVPLRPVWCSLP